MEGNIATIATVLGSVFALYWFLRKDIGNVSKNINRLERQAADTSNRLERQAADTSNRLKRQVLDTSKRIDNLYSALFEKSYVLVGGNMSDRHTPPAPHPTYEANSPITLNRKGQDVAEKIQAHQLVDRYVNKILVPNDADLLTIQTTCFSFAFGSLLNIVSAEEAKAIRDAIYEDAGNSNDILIIYGILFRNHYLKERGFTAPAYVE